MKRWARWLGVCTVSVMVASGCSGGRGSLPAAPGAGPTTSGSSPTSGTSTSATFGDLPTPCGEGNGTGATDQGVTDTSITIGYGDDAGYAASPGLEHELSDAMKAMIKWCDAEGGINGRQIDGVYYDAAVTQVNNVMLNACKQVFMLVGEGFALDGAAEAIRQGCDLPAVPGYSVSADFANAPLMHQGVPNPIDRTPDELAIQIAKAFPDKIQKTAVMYANYPSTQETADKVLQTYPKFGFQFLNCPQVFSINGEPDYKPFMLRLKDCGAQVVYFTGSGEPYLENILDAAAQVDYHPTWIADTNIYDEAIPQWNTAGNGDNVYVRTAIIPVEEASANKAVADYVDIVKGNGGDVSVLGEQATSSFLLWATAAKACGSGLTRTCILDHLSEVHNWTSGGLHAATDPGSNLPPQCGMVLKLTGTKWVQAIPAQVGTFDCSADSVVVVSGSMVDSVKLGPDRVSTEYKK